jgi:murein L,D-transpeptidase YafK
MPVRWPLFFKYAGAAVGAAVLLAACQESNLPKEMKPVPTELSDKMKRLNMSETGPVFIRIYKETSELEVWKQTRGGQYALLKVYDICKWSGVLGPKKVEGDRQAPEGFYTVTPGQMNPKSRYYLAFNIGYPNAFDQALGRTGSHLMVHGACSSAGCYSMTDESAGELFALARDSFRGGQRAFQIQAFPFRMTPQNMAKHRDSENYEFWQMLKVGSDHFEVSRVPPKVDVCDKRYVFNADAGGRKFSASDACPRYQVPPDLKVAVAQKQAADEALIAQEKSRAAYEAQKAAEEKQIAEQNRIAAEAKAAEKQAAKEAKAERNQERLGVFGRVFGGRDKQDSTSGAAAASPVSGAASDASESPVTAFAPANPVPPQKPASAPAPASPSTAAASAPPTPSAPPAAAANGEPTITPDMTPAIPSVGRFIKKQFLWIGDDGSGNKSGG